VPRRSGPDIIPHQPLVPEVRFTDRLWFTAYYTIAFVALGILVSSHKPDLLDLAGRPFAGIGVRFAVVVTDGGLFPVYASISVVLLIVGAIYRRYLRGILISVLTLVVAWQVSDACKLLFHRARPPYWVAIHEPSYSYPSGHATLVIAFYGFWTAVAWMSDLPIAAKRWIRLAFAFWAIAIGWSRLALGAHYITDVVGGYLLGAALASAAAVLYRALGPPPEPLVA
jgi:undecaprenyl-diphosphatase